MNLPLELSFHGIEKTENIEQLIREKTSKLEKFCNFISGCRIAIEKPQSHQARGSGFRVRIDLTIPPGHEIVTKTEPSEGKLHKDLQQVIRETFSSAERQLKELVERERYKVKSHPDQEVSALIKVIYPEKGYGFLSTVDGREIYFHRNSLTNEEFDHLREGTGVRFVEEQGEKGPQATSVQVICLNSPKQ